MILLGAVGFTIFSLKRKYMTSMISFQFCTCLEISGTQTWFGWCMRIQSIICCRFFSCRFSNFTLLYLYLFVFFQTLVFSHTNFIPISGYKTFKYHSKQVLKDDNKSERLFGGRNYDIITGKKLRVNKTNPKKLTCSCNSTTLKRTRKNIVEWYKQALHHASNMALWL